jgi:integrase
MRIYPRGKRGTLWLDITVDGERIKRSTGTTDRRAAEEYAATLARDLWRTKRLGETPRVVWDTAVLAWLEEHGHLRSLEEVKHNLRWLSQHLQGVELSSIDTNRIRRLASQRKAEVLNRRAIDAAIAAGLRPPEPKLTSNATVNRHLSDLSRILAYAHKRGWLAAMPPIAKLHEPAKRVPWITREEAARLLIELPDHLRAMAAFALATGLRESNIRLLCWQQVDMQRRLAWIHGDQAKAGKDISVPLNDDAMQVLLEQRGRHKRWVFPVPRWETGRDGVPRQVEDTPTGKVSNHAWRKACVRAGLPTLRFHDLRHTWASWHVQAGTPLPVLQELGGWASLSMVQRYAHLGLSHVAAWAGNIAGGGTNPVQAASAPANANGPEGPSTEGKPVGWLMGLEPTTTRITRRSSPSGATEINNLGARKRRGAT